MYFKINKTDIKTDTYKVDSGGFRVDIVDEWDTYYAFLYHNDYGTKELMFGLPKYQPAQDKHYTYDEIVNIVEANLDQHIPIYMEEQRDYEEFLEHKYFHDCEDE